MECEESIKMIERKNVLCFLTIPNLLYSTCTIMNLNLKKRFHSKYRHSFNDKD